MFTVHYYVVVEGIARYYKQVVKQDTPDGARSYILQTVAGSKIEKIKAIKECEKKLKMS